MKDTVVSVPLPIPLVHPGRAGEPMLYAATDIRISVTTTNRNKQKQWDEIVRKAVGVVKQNYPDIQCQGIGIRVSGSQGTILDGDTAILVGTVGGLLYTYRRIWNPRVIQEIAYSIIKNNFESAPAVVAACVSGGFIWSRRELPFLTSTWQLPLRLPASLQKYYILTVKDTHILVKKRHKAMKETSREEDVRAVAIALKNGDRQTLEHYYHDHGGLSSRGMYVQYDRIKKRGWQHVLIGGDGVRLESK